MNNEYGPYIAVSCGISSLQIKIIDIVLFSSYLAVFYLFH